MLYNKSFLTHLHLYPYNLRYNENTRIYFSLFALKCLCTSQTSTILWSNFQKLRGTSASSAQCSVHQVDATFIIRCSLKNIDYCSFKFIQHFVITVFNLSSTTQILVSTCYLIVMFCSGHSTSVKVCFFCYPCVEWRLGRSPGDWVSCPPVRAAVGW